MAGENVVLRTVSYWKQFFSKDRKSAMLLSALIHDKGWADGTKMSYDNLMSEMNLMGSRCLHDTDVCLHDTRRDIR